MHDIELTVENILCEIDYPSVTVYIHDTAYSRTYVHEGEWECEFLDDEILNRKVLNYTTNYNLGTLHINIYI